MEALNEREKLVQEFDRLCDQVTDEFVYFVQNYDVVDKDILVPKSIRILEPVSCFLSPYPKQSVSGF